MNPQYLSQQTPQYGGTQPLIPGYGAPTGNFVQGDTRPSPAGTPGSYGQTVGPGPQRGPPQGYNNPGMYNGDNQQHYPPPMGVQPNNLANQLSGMNIGGPMGQQRPQQQTFPPPPSKPGLDQNSFPPAVNGVPPAQPQQHQPAHFTNGSGSQFPPQPGYQQPLPAGPPQGQRPPSALGAAPGPQLGQPGPQNGQIPPQHGQFPPQQGQIPPQQGQIPSQQGQPQGSFNQSAHSRPPSATGHPQPQMGPPLMGAGPNQGQSRPPGGIPAQMGPNLLPSGMPPPTGLSAPQMGPQGSQMRHPGPQMGPPGPQMGPPGPQMGPPGPQMNPQGPQMGMPGPQMGPTGPQMGPPGPQMGPPGSQRVNAGPAMGHGPQLGHPGLQTGPPGPQMVHPGQQLSPPGSHMGQPPLGQPMRPPMGPAQQQMGYPPSQMPPQMLGSHPHGSQMPGSMGPPQPGMYLGQSGAMGQPGPHMGPPVPGSQPGYPAAGFQQPLPGQYPGMNQQQQQQKRLDPDQMPSPIQVMQDDQRNRSGVFVTNQKGLVPPIATTSFTTQDQGNCGPRFMRSTMYNVPATIDMMKQTAVPFGLVVSPLAMVFEGEYEPAVVDMGTLGPVRCIRCKAYMCPFMQFIDGGRRFHCLFCKATTEVPAEYFQHLDHTGQRVDRYERPELSLGCFEFIATTDYCRNNTIPKVPAFIFLIDVSYNNVKSGLVHLLCARMKEVIRELPKELGAEKSSMKVGFITYNSSVHFYNIKRCLAQAQMMVVGDVADMFMPLLDGFLEEPSEAEQVIDSLMADIPAMFADTRETETLLAPAIQAGLEALKASECAGKLLVFHSSLPIAEAPGKLKNRDDRKLLGTEKEKTVLVPQSNVYNNLGQECVAAGCSVDLFLFNNSYIDIATIGQVCRLSGGEVYKYTYFQSDLDGDRLIEDLKHDVSRPIAFDAIMRVRTSTGVRPTDFYGHFFMQNTTDLELGSIDCDKAIALEIKHDDKLTEEDGVYIQVALLYTSVSGQRRLRILNLSLKTCSQMADLYRSCDLDTVVNFFAKQTVSRVLESTPKVIKESLVNRCAQILAAYRKNCASPSSAGQLILPECMKLLPLYVNCVLKSDAVAGGSEMSLDDRSFVMQAVMTMDVPSTVAFFYPRLLPLIDLPEDLDVLPPQVRCSSEKLKDDEAYLLENGIHMFVWIGLNVPADWVQDVFGVQSAAQIDIDRTALPQLDNAASQRTRSLVEAVRTERHRSMRLTLVRQRDKMELVLKHFLVEDRGMDSSASYVDFLCHMHKEIRALLS